MWNLKLITNVKKSKIQIFVTLFLANDVHININKYIIVNVSIWLEANIYK